MPESEAAEERPAPAGEALHAGNSRTRSSSGRDGIIHNEAEFSSKEQCAKGAQVLLQAVLDYDRQLAERGGTAKARG